MAMVLTQCGGRMVLFTCYSMLDEHSKRLFFRIAAIELFARDAWNFGMYNERMHNRTPTKCRSSGRAIMFFSLTVGSRMKWLLEMFKIVLKLSTVTEILLYSFDKWCVSWTNSVILLYFCFAWYFQCDHDEVFCCWCWCWCCINDFCFLRWSNLKKLKRSIPNTRFMNMMKMHYSISLEFIIYIINQLYFKRHLYKKNSTCHGRWACVHFAWPGLLSCLIAFCPIKKNFHILSYSNG